MQDERDNPISPEYEVGHSYPVNQHFRHEKLGRLRAVDRLE